LGKAVIDMTQNMVVAFYIAVLIAVIVSVDIVFFRHHFWARLMVNIGIVLVFTAFYFRFLTRRSRNQRRQIGYGLG
jgi:type IV secretory pathway VirB2 component (pilin)